jgi:hypothetical protein
VNDRVPTTTVDTRVHIERGDLLDILEHPNPERCAGQRIFVVQREDYVYLARPVVVVGPANHANATRAVGRWHAERRL